MRAVLPLAFLLVATPALAAGNHASSGGSPTSPGAQTSTYFVNPSGSFQSHTANTYFAKPHLSPDPTHLGTLGVHTTVTPSGRTNNTCFNSSGCGTTFVK